MSPKILLVEDDPNLGTLLEEYLKLKGNYEVTLCTDGEEAIRAFHSQSFDLCILDVMMPKKDGFAVGREIRQVNAGIPIIFATAKSMMEDKTEGFSLGGDDYITKPFRIEELLLRIKALLKRTRQDTPEQNQETTIFRIGKYEFDYPSQVLRINGKEQKMSGKEAELLRLLCLHAGQLLAREEALLTIWNNDNYFTGRSMDVFLSKLRKYLKDDPNVEILNVHGKGYRLVC
ncbi:DNA-binding response OmpR family regulator [Anseongella ginsenosidimutans]|uniref:DNA-binding response OmpR family regulator n=1 Tax=Anseongella ginsenosidimutans TaxID=496056 RepID=A0A4V2UT59_9SPHI|nr:response regulator transcription factor [Anseongella ginsenosidimutans]QEC51483.1 response regulator transcription factor [Anseongella ginsenosidimutans]TCS84339.1 DNA-binding response OmpR family regulator [Anseongella ginsenosidimutans]